MALTKKRREELGDAVDTASTWINHAGRAGKLRAIAAELRGEDVDDAETAENLRARLEAAEKAEAEAAEAAAARAEQGQTANAEAKKAATKKAAARQS